MHAYSTIPRGHRRFTDGMTLEGSVGLHLKYARIEDIKESGVNEYVVVLNQGDGDLLEHTVDQESMDQLTAGTRSGSVEEVVGKCPVDVLYSGGDVTALSAHPHISYWSHINNKPWTDETLLTVNSMKQPSIISNNY